MNSTFIWLFLMAILARIIWGLYKGARRVSRAARSVRPENDDHLNGEEIEDAVWEEIKDDERKSP